MSFRRLEWLIWTVRKCFATLTVKAWCTHCNATVAFLFIDTDSLFCYLLHVLPVQKTTITSRESEIILLTVCTKTNWLRLRSWCCCRGGGVGGLQKGEFMCTKIYMPQPTTVNENARYEDWSALARKTQTQTQTPTQKALYTDTNANTSTLKYVLVYIIMRRTKWIFWRSNFLTAESSAEESSLCPCSYFTRGKAEK